MINPKVIAINFQNYFLQDTTYLEACIENSTKSLLFLDHVRFDPQPPMTVSVLEVESNENDESEGPLRCSSCPLFTFKLVLYSSDTFFYMCQYVSEIFFTLVFKMKRANIRTCGLIFQWPLETN